MKNKTDTKKRTYTTQERSGVPCLTIKGKFLTQEFGINVGSQLELIEGKNMLVLLKVPAAVTERNNKIRQLAVMEKQAQYLREELSEVTK